MKRWRWNPTDRPLHQRNQSTSIPNFIFLNNTSCIHFKIVSKKIQKRSFYAQSINKNCTFVYILHLEILSFFHLPANVNFCQCKTSSKRNTECSYKMAFNFDKEFQHIQGIIFRKIKKQNGTPQFLCSQIYKPSHLRWHTPYKKFKHLQKFKIQICIWQKFKSTHWFVAFSVFVPNSE